MRQDHWPFWKALVVTLLIVVAFRGLIDLLFRRLIPWPSLFGLESQQHREEDVLGRRRAWFWHFWLRVGVTVALVVTVIWLFRGGSWFGTFGSIGHGAGPRPQPRRSSGSRSSSSSSSSSPTSRSCSGRCC